ncbi:tannase/feruloyl esterase family alpha/beta hydrolase [Sphingomonas sp. HF-S3]|uniref:Tannase/feruloyl esterase family alpha/beta hydrolase n=1 Tax=Sphingomonas rustica TaxID=3103142 RepID=A0ABV0B506_9SPHN
MRIDGLTLLSATAMPVGEFRPGPVTGPAPAGIALPAHCRVRAVATPVRGSRIGFELWLPERGWNGRFKMYGNGGYSSTLPLGQMAQGLKGGYAVAGTDTGHQGDDPEFAVGLPESIADWGHRAVHQTVLHSKALLYRFYGRPAAHAYFEGCSTGGHQALMSAQRYPRDFDGIIAGAPGNNRTRLNIGFLWQFVANRRPGTSDPILTAAKLPLLTKAALDQCGTPAERSQGYLENPFSCRVDLTKLQCGSGDEPGHCLTADEGAAAARLYRGATNPRTGARLYPPWLPGSERGWAGYWADPRDQTMPARSGFFRFWAFNDPRWDWRSFDFDQAVRRIDPALAGRIDAVDPDLSAFARGGGRLILYHGLADPVVSPWDLRAYYDAVDRSSMGRAASFSRLFFAPGMGHCGGGPTPDAAATQAALEQWVEQGRAPTHLTAGARNLCPYPAIGGACRP